MRPLTLKLRGAIGIRDGLGLDEIEIDFTKFSPGLVCIVGSNGSGKTTILDNMNPYVQLGSRSGALARHFFLSDSYRDFTFDVSGYGYRSLVLINAVSGETEAYLYRNGSPLNDGRITTYRKEVDKLLGSADLFFRSIFVAQGASGITSLTPARRKELFFELLGLEKYALYAERTKEELMSCEKDIAVKKSRLEGITRELESRSKVERELESAEQELEGVRSWKALLAHRLREAQSKLEAIVCARVEAEQEFERYLKCSQEFCEVENDYLQSQREFQLSAQRLEIRRSELTKEMVCHEDLIGRKQLIAQSVRSLETLREREHTFELLEQRIRDIEKEETEDRFRVEKLRGECQLKIASVERRIGELEGEKKRFERDVEHARSALTAQLASVRRQAEIIDRVPCHEFPGLPEGCLLLAEAHEARLVIPGLEQSLSDMAGCDAARTGPIAETNHEIRRAQEELVRLKEHRAMIGVEDRFAIEKCRIGYDAAKHITLRKEIEKLEGEGWEHLSEDLRLAEAVVAEKKSQLETLTRELEAMGEAHRLRCEKSREKIRLLAEELSGSDFVRERLEQLRRHEEDERVNKGKLEKELDASHAREIALYAKFVAATAARDRLAGLARESQSVEEDLKERLAKRGNWSILFRACSKEGIPALELDCAGPNVSGIANELLSRSFGTEFQISLETLRPSKDGTKQIETFEINIYNENGQKRIEDLSGGERVWIERAISEAVAIYHSEQSGREYGTSYQDEADGALDPENRQNYLRMLEEAFRVGRRSYTFVVTQSPELWQQVDQRIVLSQGDIEYVY